MEAAVNENSEHPVAHDQDNMVPDSEVSNHEGSEPKHEFNVEEIRSVLEVIASTGKFWLPVAHNFPLERFKDVGEHNVGWNLMHDWDKLKSMISFQLKQVLSEYPEANMPTEQQNASLGETYPELLKRLDEALLCFVEGPPFTLQRLCEVTALLYVACILLAARSIYPNLSKLALALEKNLLVTSTLNSCTDPYPQMTHMTETPVESDKASEEAQLHSNSVENGAEPLPMVDGDEVMVEVEEADIDDEMTIDMEALEEIVGPSEKNATPTENS
ncbi:hypothetical protein EZV62_012597 [Acer yangbiense]|uniref:Uncharacterized protein n=1 Tax=Acer yangbiense TaxID=1000413 RepID=A0A5C7HWP6_9ROSI|nr:hypothetical protein EZV62_012597 [Acer yangbiense]